MGCIFLLYVPALLVYSGCATKESPQVRPPLPPPPVQEAEVLVPPPQEETPRMVEGYLLPVEHPSPRVSSCFGEPRGRSRRHKGIDLEVPEGTPVVAAKDGVIRFSGCDGAYGNIIVIAHDDETETAYAHLKLRHIKANEPVKCGQEIGLVGRTGNATAFHLHFEIRKNGVRVNPEPMLVFALNKK